MKASTPAFGQVLDSKDIVVQNDVWIRLPIWHTNLCPNPNFEYGLLGWSNALGTVDPVFTRISTPTLLEPTAAWFTNYVGSIAWGTGATGSGILSFTVPTKLGATYTFSVRVSDQVAGRSIVQATGINLGTVAGTTTVSAGTYQQLFVTFVASDTVTTMRIVNNAATTAGQISLISNACVEEAAQPPTVQINGDSYPDINLLGNCSFDQAFLYEWWTDSGYDDVTRDPLWTSDGGPYSLKLTPNDPANTTFITADPNLAGFPGGFASGMLPGRTYTASGDCYVPAALTGTLNAFACRIVLYYLDSGGSPVSFQSQQGPVTGGQARVSVTMTIPANATGAFMIVYNGAGNSSANVVQWDGMMLRQDTQDTEFFGGVRLSTRRWNGTPGNSTSQINTATAANMTADCESIAITREITTDMPAGTRLIAGFPSASATVVLTGMLNGSTDENDTVQRLFNPYDPLSALYNNDPIDADVVLKHGVYTDAGAEMKTTFTGNLDSVVFDPDTGDVTLACIDNRNRLRPTVSMPSIAYFNSFATTYYGLSGGWILDYLCRQNNLNTSPGPRPLCSLYMSGHGSAYPEVKGTIDPTNPMSGNMAISLLTDPLTGTYSGSPQDFFDTYTDGVWTDQLAPEASVFNAVLLNPPSVSSTGHIYVEGWLRPRDCGHPAPSIKIGGFGITSDFPRFEIGWNWSPGDITANCTLTVTRHAGSATKSIPDGTIYTDRWNHVSIFVQMTGSTTATVTLVIDGFTYVDNITGLPASGAEQTLKFGQIVVSGDADSVQITNEASLPVPYRNFFPNAYLDPSLNALIATADVTGQDPWTIIQALCEAEQAIGGFDEQNIFRFKNRNNLLAARVARQVTSTTSLKTGLQLTTDKASVGTHISAICNTLSISPPVTVWAADTVIRLGPHGTSVQLVSPSVPVLEPANVDSGYFTSVLAGRTSWSAARDAAGNTAVTTGIKVSAIILSPSLMQITIANSNAFPVYMVIPVGFTGAGNPNVVVGGANIIQSDAPAVADSQWPDSADGGAATNRFGDITVNLTSNVWRQDYDSAQGLTDDVLDDLHLPRPSINGLAIVGDPRLQVADRVTIIDPDGTMMNDDVVLSNIQFADSATDWTHTLTARTIGPPGGWIMGDPVRGVLGVTTIV